MQDALRKVGLLLVSTKAPEEFLIIDHAESRLQFRLADLYGDVVKPLIT